MFILLMIFVETIDVLNQGGLFTAPLQKKAPEFGVFRSVVHSHAPDTPRLNPAAPVIPAERSERRDLVVYKEERTCGLVVQTFVLSSAIQRVFYCPSDSLCLFCVRFWTTKKARTIERH